MRACIPTFALVLLSLCLHAGEAEPTGRALTVEETDKAVESIFEKARQVTRIETELKTTKTGILKGGAKSIAYETIRYEAPNRVWWQNRGENEGAVADADCSLILMVGGWMWEIEPVLPPDPRRASRRKMKDFGQDGRTVNLAAFLIGSDVQSAKEIRDRFELSAWMENEGGPDASYRLLLVPRSEGQTVELWIKPGDALPWKVRTVERKQVVTVGAAAGAAPRTKLHEEIRELRALKTNLTGLEPFAPETFLFPLAPGMKITDEDANCDLSEEDIRKFNQAQQAGPGADAPKEK